jgi:endonuclease/exonuclease/phosphatase family metal-dependent hydrolase
MSLALCLAACGSADDSVDERANVGLQEPVAGAATDTLRVATLNMSVGWRAESLVLNKLSDTAVVYSAVQTLYNQFETSQPSERIRVMARAIVAHPVDVLALQEVQVMRLNASPEFHFLDTLLTVLDSLEGGRKWQVARQQINRVNANVANAEGSRLDIAFWEGQATLVRTSLEVVESDSAVFSKLVSFPILSENFDSERGYVRTTVRKPSGAVWQLYNTHLEVELLSLFNAPQGIELNSVVWDDWQNLATGAQVVLGDLNAYNGKAGLGALTSAGSGLLDAWNVANGEETVAAYTCCVANLDDPLSGGYDRRLDYILVRNVLTVENVQSLSLQGSSVWGGDHAMVRAELIQQL